MSTPLHSNDKGLTPITNAHHLTNLYLTLEQLVYIQIAILYYRDNSFLSLFLRCIATTSFVPPTAAALHRVPVVLFLNGICVLQHLFGGSPTPISNASRGYMDGSVLIDFVGEFAHTSRFKLLFEDFLLLGLNLLMMVVGNMKQRSKQEPKEEPSQDLDAEEQGVRRGTTEDVVVNNSNGDIEMQQLLSGPASTDSDPDLDSLPTVIELRVMHELRDVIKNNNEVYNRVRAGNEEALRAVLQAVAAGRARPVGSTTATENGTADVTTAAANTATTTTNTTT